MRDMFHGRLFSHVARHHRSCLYKLALQMIYELFSSEGCLGLDCQRIAKVDVLGPRQFFRQTNEVRVGGQSLGPVVGVSTPQIDESVEFLDLVYAEGTL